MDHQNWNITVLKKTQPVKHTHVMKPKTDFTEETKLKKYPAELVKEIIKFRVDNKMSRKEFAIKLNITDGVLAQIESKTGVYNCKLVDKFKRYVINHKKKLERKDVKN
jgi:ribosome-binding protein aMBF1 (putative translation factor)